MPEEGNGYALQLGCGRSGRGRACVDDVMVQKVTLKIDEMDTRTSKNDTEYEKQDRLACDSLCQCNN